MREASVVRIVPLLVAFLLLHPLPAATQSWAGQGRLHGVVLDDDEKPLEGAEVRLTPARPPGSPPAEGPAPVVTDAQGRWALGGLAQGPWRIVISAEGCIQSEGQVTVEEGPGQRLEVVLRSLDQVLPFAAENPSSVYGWLEKGNSLLAQGRPAEARAEYQRALRVLPPDQQPEVLRAVARTYYLEKNVDAAVNALERALLFGPTDNESRQLYTALLEGLQRGDEARAWLARLDAEGPGALASEVEQPPDMPAVAASVADDEPTLAPEPGRTGAYRTAFRERSPLSMLDVFLERNGADRAEVLEIDPKAGLYDLGRETFQVFVPEDYDASTPYGLFVWVSPTPSGKLHRPDNIQVLRDRHLIWVGANNSGNGRFIWDRVGLALDAAQAMEKLYRIDERRVYVGGYSGGGRMATRLSVLYPEVFRGGVLYMGCDYYRRVPLPDKPGAHWPAAFAEPPADTLKLVRERNRYVFVTGENDFNRLQTRTYYRLYRKDGFQHLTYVEIPGANHYSGIGGEWLAKLIDALDEGLDGTS